MYILPGLGHLLPMVPLAHALQRPGHDVAFATSRDVCPTVARRGFEAFAAGLSLSDQLARSASRYPEQAGLATGMRRFEEFVPRMLAGVAAPARAADLIPVLDAFKPDVVVHDETEFGAPVAAAVAGVPYVDHSVGILRPMYMASIARETIAPLWKRYGAYRPVTSSAVTYTYSYRHVPSYRRMISCYRESVSSALARRFTQVPIAEACTPVQSAAGPFRRRLHS